MLPSSSDSLLSALARSAPEDFACVREVAQCVRDRGGRALLVGGCVRDALRGVPAHDFDVEIYGIAPDALLSLLSSRWTLNQVGASFGVVKLSHHDIDIALPRRENLIGRGHRDFAIAADPQMPVREAAARRDFTINAILLDPLTGEVVDPWGGRADLERGILRHVSDHFSEDPLRVMRAMQFLARFPLTPAPETVALCATMPQDALPFERLAAEWEKLLLQGEKPSRGLAFLRACGWIHGYPELEAMIGCPQNPAFHPEGDVWRHTCLALDAAVALRRENREDNLLLTLAALTHDVGKPLTTRTGPRGTLVSYGHEVEGLPLVERFVSRLWNQPKLVQQVVRLVRAHMRPVRMVLDACGPKAYRRLSLEVVRLDLLADLVECDIRATLAPPERLDLVKRFREKTAKLSIAASPPEPLVLGRDLIARGMAPGPAFKPILDACFDAQISGAFHTEAEAQQYLAAFLAARGDEAPISAGRGDEVPISAGRH